MSLNRHHVEWFSLIFFLCLVGVVFQQIATDLVDQGIAGGDPFHDAAFYPRAVSLLIIGVVLIRAVALIIEIRAGTGDVPSMTLAQLARPAQLVVLFGAYLFLLDTLGYHLVTTPFIAMVMMICEDRKPVQTLAFSAFCAFLIAFLFEKYLHIVLPVGVFSLNIPW